MSNQGWPSGSERASSCCLPQVSSSFSVAAAMFRRRKKRRRPEISVPHDFQHRVHTSFDITTGRYVGLPPQWQSVIDTLRRPRPLVDPSRITEVELRKVKFILTRPNFCPQTSFPLSFLFSVFPSFLPTFVPSYFPSFP